MSNKKKIVVVILSILKVIIPVAICIAVVAMILSLTVGKNSSIVENTFETIEGTKEPEVTLTSEPLVVDSYPEVNELIKSYYQAFADGNIDKINEVRDYCDELELIKIQKKSEFIEQYDNVVCYTKKGLEDGAYFVFVTYDCKLQGLDTALPGFYSWYVCTDENGKLYIKTKRTEDEDAAMKAISNHEEVVDIYNRISVKYHEVEMSEENLNDYLADYAKKVSDAVALEISESVVSTDDTETNENEVAVGSSSAEPSNAETSSKEEGSSEADVQIVQIVNQKVKATDTVNVRSSDSELADKLGKVTKGTKLTRTEIKINGWSKVIYNGKEAYIKSDYLEPIETENTTTNANAIGVVKAKSNVNVRSKADQNSDRIGLAQEGSVYNLLEIKGDWYKIDYKGKEGYVKSEFFEK